MSIEPIEIITILAIALPALETILGALPNNLFPYQSRILKYCGTIGKVLNAYKLTKKVKK